MRTLLVASICLLAVPSGAAPLPFPTFKVQEIDKTLKVGYGLRVADLNADGKLDVIVADANRVIWFDNAGGWKLRTIIDNANAGVKPDNVCLAVHDIDGDGKLDVALGADWQINNTAAGGSLQWLRQPGNIDEPWAVRRIAESIPTLHRVHFGDLDRDGKLELIVAPIRGRNSTLRENYMDKPVQLLSYAIPADPTGAWGETKVVDESTHQTHNFTVMDPAHSAGLAVMTASAEGVGALVRAGDGGAWSWKHLGRGNQDNPKGARGSGEVKAGFVDNGPKYIAAIEPLHGHQVVVYQFRAARVRTDDAGNPLPGPPPGPDDHLAVRTVVDDKLKGGHALWCVDLDGDGIDEIVTGAREGEPGAGRGVNAYKMSGATSPPVFQKHVLDDQAMACEDLACADLNGDGKVDIVAAGRATGNVRIYWNEGVPAAK